MPVYFFLQEAAGPWKIKIGKADNIERRRKQLQTGSPYLLNLVGFIRSKDDFALEKALHQQLAGKRSDIGEWFDMQPAEILPVLQQHLHDAFVAKTGQSFEIVGHDGDGIPEFMGVWEWGDLELEECCPICGWLGGMYFQEASQGHYCIECRTLEFFHTEEPDGPED